MRDVPPLEWACVFKIQTKELHEKAEQLYGEMGGNPLAVDGEAGATANEIQAIMEGVSKLWDEVRQAVSAA